ncbi:MAG: hypothetical protein WC796_03710 [Candidatus Pacearchaeota archaeon]
MNKILIILLSFVFFVLLLVSVNGVYAQVIDNPCAQVGGCYVQDLDKCLSIGQVYNQQYCEYDGTLTAQKELGTDCLNDYECVNAGCLESKCQVKYQLQNTTFLQRIFDTIKNIFIPANDLPCTSDSNCSSTEYCDLEAGLCRDRESSCDDATPYRCSDGRCVANSGNCGGGGGGCSGYLCPDGRCVQNVSSCNICTNCNCFPHWDCTNWSNFDQSCGTRNCVDLHRCSKIIGKPSEYRACGEEPPPEEFCGNDNCAANIEDCASCPSDCGECGIIPPITSKSFLVFWVVLLIILIILVIGIIIVALFYKNNKPKSKSSTSSTTISKPSSGSGGSLSQVKSAVSSSTVLSRGIGATPVARPVEQVRPPIQPPRPTNVYSNSTKPSPSQQRNNPAVRPTPDRRFPIR